MMMIHLSLVDPKRCCKLMRGGNVFNTMRDIVEMTYRHTFHLQYKNQPPDSKIQVIQRLQ